MQRGFECEFTGESCEDSRCKKGFCVPYREFRREWHPLTTAEKQEAQVIARLMLVFLHKVRNPTAEQVLRVAQRPAIIEMARREIARAKSSQTSN